MDPITIGSAISAGASVVGGLLGRNKAVKAGDVIRQTRAGILGQASGARQASERYGFNPLTLLGVSQPLVPQAVDNSMMGSAIANAGLAVAEGINASSAQKAYVQKLEEQNQELRKSLDGQTLRPKVPGIYGAPTPTAGVAGSVEVPVGVGDTPIEHKWIKIWDANTKRFTWYPNPDIMDAGPTEMATGMATIGAAEAGQHGSPGGFDFMFRKLSPPPSKSERSLDLTFGRSPWGLYMGERDYSEMAN